ncbi:MAG: hypothetical protein KC776_12705 [Myxococcales bacterium]|nr:hypothetical protein [Myxococcales bacterium]MCB9577800.1 hypothetical protein [Polyangiaceae bacterium]
MPAPPAPLIGFLVGVGFAWAAREELGRAGTVLSRSLVVVCVFGAIVFAPIAAYFLALAPDWSFAYVIDTRRLPRIVELSLVLLDALSVPLGFVLAAPRGTARPSAWAKLGALPALAVLVFAAAALPRLTVSATYAQYHGDFGVRPVAGSPLGYALLWMSAVLLAAVAWTVHSLRRLGQSARRD